METAEVKQVKNARCSFCGKSGGKDDRLAQGIGNVYICENCARLCLSVINGIDRYVKAHEEGCNSTATRIRRKPNGTAPEKTRAKSRPRQAVCEGKAVNGIKPEEIKAFLDNYVISQDAAKKTLAVAIYNHRKRIRAIGTGGVDIQKSNILLMGPTGSGKTYLAQTLAKVLDVPFTTVDATAMTEAGYMGNDVEDILARLLLAAGNDVSRAEEGIIYIDEIDKIAAKSDNGMTGRDVSGEGVQQSLLKILEGDIVDIRVHDGSGGTKGRLTQIDTKNILFICGGAFEGLVERARVRTTSRAIGFGARGQDKGHSSRPDETKTGRVSREALIRYGLIPELLGRLPVVVKLESLDKESLIRILTEPEDALVKQYQRLLEMDGVNLRFTDEALNEIAERAMERESGARGIRSVMEEVMEDIMYKIPSRPNTSKCTVTQGAVTGNEEAIFVENVVRRRTAGH